MKRTIAVIHADLERTPLGTRSRLGDELGGQPILRRTVERVRAARGLAECVVLSPAGQEGRCEAVLAGLGVVVQRVEAPDPAWRALVRVSRKWSLAGWRGGVGGTTSLDEYLHPQVVAALLELRPADRVMIVPPAAVLVCPDVVDAMIERHDRSEEDNRLAFAQAPPGVAGTIYNADLIRELADKNIPPGWILSYKPDAPRKDLAFFSCCFEVRAPLRYGGLRLIADTDRWAEVTRAAWRVDPAPNAEQLGRVVADLEAGHVPRLPNEVEIELTTDDPYPSAVLHPRGDRVGRRGPLSIETVRKIASELGALDDSLVVLGGFGDPLRHPRFPEVLRVLREAGVFGVAVRTAGVDLTEDLIETLLDYQVDVLNVLMDGWTAETYAAMHAPDVPHRASLEHVRSRVDRLEARKRERGCVAPIVVPEMIKAKPTLAELPAFFDGWVRRLGTVNVAGFSHRSRQAPDLAVMSTAPPSRTACRRLQSRVVVLADGSVVLCDQDFRGLTPVGDAGRDELEAVWRGEAMARVREAHVRGDAAAAGPLCGACEEWHRP
ncbi:MAG: SPASM domain-containing protein [Phycisphaerae bacterium]|nr:MAG: hypothetical protein EDS66_00145 [Planctomycetota bacterium]KAB2949240.1 MAG: hypothetical protein F9K17_03635 [Phycisphaerae bacterium]MBE7455694.1 SPASM domain-containing protein [Planctomycetia bacterium]MCK6463330.1 SPASM domain-containing protein [Phycisphaerae bacterium]MCL4716952.1 SPASM domain-containing protein [Phycisphaerae bacterium]